MYKYPRKRIPHTCGDLIAPFHDCCDYLYKCCSVILHDSKRSRSSNHFDDVSCHPYPLSSGKNSEFVNALARGVLFYRGNFFRELRSISWLEQLSPNILVLLRKPRRSRPRTFRVFKIYRRIFWDKAGYLIVGDARTFLSQKSGLVSSPHRSLRLILRSLPYGVYHVSYGSAVS